MRIIMMGTGPFAVPTFRRLVASPHEVVRLVTRGGGTEQSGRKKTPPNPMAEAAEALGVEVDRVADANAPEVLEQLRALHPDLLVVCDFGTILSREALGIAPRGAINLHGSLLPKYRGAAPVQWAIYHGEEETGVTVIHLTRRLDAGPIIEQRATPIGAMEDAVQLEQRLAQLGVEAVEAALERIAAWDRVSPLGVPQDEVRATPAPRLRKSHGRIDWSRSAEQIERQVRAFRPWPGSTTWWERKPGKWLPLLVERARVPTGGETATAAPGSVVAARDAGIRVATGDGCLDLLELKPAGKRRMAAGEFLRGYRLEPGTILGSPP